ncbi:ABC transporter permease [Enterococcus bulliens]
MQAFFNDRVKKHQQQMQRYLRYVFNDHFALLMTLLIGAGGLYYSNFLKTLTPPFSIGRIFIVLIFLLALTFGRYASLTKPADQLFLLPKETQMRQYLVKALRYSCIVPFAMLFLIVGAVMPLYVVSTAQGFVQFFSLFIMMATLKFSHLLVQQTLLFLIPKKDSNALRSFFGFMRL